MTGPDRIDFMLVGAFAAHAQSCPRCMALAAAMARAVGERMAACGGLDLHAHDLRVQSFGGDKS